MSKEENGMRCSLIMRGEPESWLYRAPHGYSEGFRCCFLCNGKSWVNLKQESDMIWFMFKIFLMFIFERERERERQSMSGGRGRERGKQRIWGRLQTRSCQHRAWCEAWTEEPWDHDLSWSWCLTDWATQAPLIWGCWFENELYESGVETQRPVRS